MLELYHAEPVANSMKVLLCLKEKGIEFTSHYVDLLRFEQHQPEFVAINPNGQVPVLVHDGATKCLRRFPCGRAIRSSERACASGASSSMSISAPRCP
jgi:hypothetical protein